MDATDSTLPLGVSLLRWIQSFAPDTNTLSDLRDGHTLFHVLADIDAEYFATCTLPAPSTHETSSNWIPRWQNLKHIQHIVAAYVRDVCGVLDAHAEHAASVPDQDLKALAMLDTSQADHLAIDHQAAMVTILKGILRAAMYSPVSNQRMGRTVLSLGPDAAKSIAAAMAAMEESGDDVYEASPDAPASPFSAPKHNSADPFAPHDMTLEQEERMLQAHRTIRQLEATNAKASIELDSLRKDKHELQQALESFKYEIANTGHQKAEAAMVQDLRRKADQDRDYIADLETDLSSTKATLQSLERQLERFKSDTGTKQDLRDELQLLKADRDEMAQKARAVDNLGKKIQLLQDQERQSITARDDLRAAREQLQVMDGLKERCERLQKSNSENLNIIANTEQEIFDQKTSKKRLEHELKVTLQKFEAARDRQFRDQETIADLERRLQQYQGTEHSTPASVTNGGLESELLEAESKSLLPTSRASSKDLSAEIEIQVEERLRAITAKNRLLQSEYLAMLQDKLGLETVVKQYQGASTSAPEQNVPFLEQRKRLDLAQHEINKLKDAMYSLTADLASAKERLLTAHTPLLGLSRRGSKNDEASSDAESIATDTIQDLKAEYQSLTKSYGDLTRHAEDVEAQLAQHKSLVRHALLTHRALLLEPEETRKSDEYKLVLEQLKQLDHRQPAESEDMVIDIATSVADKIESARSAVATVQKKLSERHRKVADLERQLGEAHVVAATSGTGAQRSAEMEMLRRENRLVASAWYDLTSRLQSTDVTINMRRGSPKSYLMKQRAAVGLRAPFGPVQK